MQEKVKEWLIDWFASHTSFERNDICAHVKDNYFEQGFVDSFDFITLVGDIEEAFGICFSNEQFEDRRFSSIEGLATIIKRYRDERGL